MTARRRTLRVLSVLVAAIAVAALSSSTARADSTVVYDDAGDAPRISLIGDSTLAAVRWYADYGDLERYNFVYDAESCRRTIERSCWSREDVRPPNVISTMQILDGQLGEVLVVMNGYDDPVWTIDEAIAGVVAEAQRQGVGHVVWLSLRTSPDVDYSDPQEQSSVNTFREYNSQLVDAAAASDGYLQVADWATYSNGASEWFEFDGVHLTPDGVDALTTFIAGVVDRVIAGQNVSPGAAPWTVLVPGAEGRIVVDVQEALIAAGIDVAGGADGVYGDATMAAVAEFQRQHDGLQVTGAVDLETARVLGVYEEPVEETTTTTAAPTTIAPATTMVAAASDADDDDPVPGWALVAMPLAAFGVAIVSRRRWVVTQRALRAADPQ